MSRTLSAAPVAQRRGTLGLGHGTALYLGAVLGPGVLVLPQLAAAAAGPASILAWGGLLALSVPVAVTFAVLGARFPDGGGVSTFARHAFGPRVAAAVGWWFYTAIPVGILAAGLIGAEYVTDAFGLPRAALLPVALAVPAAAFAANHAGLRLSGRAQLLLTALLTGLLLAAVVGASGEVRAENFTPFAPHGVPGVLDAAAVLFWAFAGWEAASHLSGEFADPGRDLRRVTAATLGIVGVLYLGLATVSVGALGPDAADSPVPLALLIERGVGGGGPLVAVVAVALTLGALNAHIAGASRLGAALARDGALPRALAKGSGTGSVPHRSLAVLAVLAVLGTVATLVWPIGVEPLMRITSASLTAVTCVGCAAAVRLLPRGAGRYAAMAATGFTAVVLVSCGWYLLVPVGVGAAAMAVVRVRRR